MAVLKAEAKNFDNADAGTAVTAGEHGRVRPRRKIGDDRRFAIVRGRDPGRLDVRLLGVSPVVVKRNRNPVSIVQFQSRILERMRDAGRGQRWADGAHDYSRAAGSAGENKPGNHHAVIRRDETAGANIAELR